MDTQRPDSLSCRNTVIAPPVPDSEPRLREEGWAAGFEWAAEEARRGLLHPLDLHDVPRIQIVIERAQSAFGGRCRGKKRPFIHGFVQGAAQYWRVHAPDQPYIRDSSRM